MTEQAVFPSALPPTGPELRVSSVGRLIGASLLDTLLMLVTLIVGWWIWAAISVGEGATPGKKLMKMRAVDKDTGATISWPRYVFLRGLIGGIILNIPVIGWILAFMPLWDQLNQSVNGKVSNSVVVDVV